MNKKTQTLSKMNFQIEKSINLNGIRKNVPDLTKSWGSERYDAALICLNHNNHKSGVVLNIEGVEKEKIPISWKSRITDKMKRTWKDLQEATERGAEGLSVLLIHRFTKFKIIERSAKGTGIDYWMSDKESILPFQCSARLEISGLLNRNDSDFKQRIKKKKNQTKRSDSTNLPAYVAVVEFNTPKAALIKR